MTDAWVASRPASRKAWDTYYDVVDGLTLRVSPFGKKTWTVKTQVEGRVVDRKIGNFPAMSIAEARGEAIRRVK